MPDMSVACGDCQSGYCFRRLLWCALPVPPRGKVSYAGFGGTAAGDRQRGFRSMLQLKTSPIALRRGVLGGTVWIGSGETQLDALPGPVPFELIVTEQGLCSKCGRMTAVYDRLGYLRS